MLRFSLFVPLLCAVLLHLPSEVAATEVELLEPRNDAVIGPRFMFKFAVEDMVAGSEIQDLRFRIVISSDGFRTEDYVFDQTANKNGWAFWLATDLDEFPELEELEDLDPRPGAGYYLRKPLEDGEYEWRADVSSDGFTWTEGADTNFFRVDTVPPTRVEGLEIDFDASRQILTLQWEPVYYDALGGTEEVARYHVYRYRFPGTARLVVGAREIGVTEETYFVDGDAANVAGPLFFYVIRAEDVAGNLTDKRVPRMEGEPRPKGPGPRPKGDEGRRRTR
jgi:hypothetical protein